MNWEKLYPNLNFTVEKKMGDLHKLYLSFSHFKCNVQITCEMKTTPSTSLHSAIIL